MYICKNCGNSEKFIGYVQEQGKAFIYQNDCSTEPNRTVNAVTVNSGYNSKKNEIYSELISENLSWAYFLSGKDWKSKIELKKCSYCNSSDIIWK